MPCRAMLRHGRKTVCPQPGRDGARPSRENAHRGLRALVAAGECRRSMDGHAPSWPRNGVPPTRTRRSASLQGKRPSRATGPRGRGWMPPFHGGPCSVMAAKRCAPNPDATERVPPGKTPIEGYGPSWPRVNAAIPWRAMLRHGRGRIRHAMQGHAPSWPQSLVPPIEWEQNPVSTNASL
jgi:hypothetical protein